MLGRSYESVNNGFVNTNCRRWQLGTGRCIGRGIKKLAVGHEHVSSATNQMSEQYECGVTRKQSEDQQIYHVIGCHVI